MAKTYKFSDLEFATPGTGMVEVRGYIDDDRSATTSHEFTIELPPKQAARLIEELANRLARTV